MGAFVKSSVNFMKLHTYPDKIRTLVSIEHVTCMIPMQKERGTIIYTENRSFDVEESMEEIIEILTGCAW